MIVKIQRPIMTNGDTPMVLIYNRSRSVNTQWPLSDELNQLFSEGEYKAYFRADLDTDGKLYIGKKIGPQSF